mgnify:CR=1 FL=1
MSSLGIISKPLNGTIMAQPSKSMAHRAIICASLANGVSNIDNIVLSDDIKATLGAVEALGADIIISKSAKYQGRKSIKIKARGKINIRNNEIDCMESGTTARFIIPITRLNNESVTIKGRGRLVERPFEVYKDLFSDNGIEYHDSNGKMPIYLAGQLEAGEYTLPGNVSSQFVSGLLFALPLLNLPSRIIISGKLESLPYIQMTLQVLEEFGISIEHDSEYKCYNIKPHQEYKPLENYSVEGDWSQTAFFCVMGAISGKITIEGLNTNSLQGDKVILDILESMGAKVDFSNKGITFYKSELNGTTVDVSQCPDLVSAIAVAGSVSKGKTSIINGARLRIKESDRILTTFKELRNLGAEIEEQNDGLEIIGKPKLSGGKAYGSEDHRIVMALASASTVCSNNVVIEGYNAVSKSYPEFWMDFVALGGEVEYY